MLTIEGVRFASISKKTPLSKLSFAFVLLALTLLGWTRCWGAAEVEGEESVTKEGKSGFWKVGSGLGLGEAGWAGSARGGSGIPGGRSEEAVESVEAVEAGPGGDEAGRLQGVSKRPGRYEGRWDQTGGGV